MMIQWFSLLLMICIFLGCSTINKSTSVDSSADVKIIFPPHWDDPQWSQEASFLNRDKVLLEQLALHPDPATEWWVKYQRARLWSRLSEPHSCQLFIELSQEKSFALQALAQVRAHQECSQMPEKWKKLMSLPDLIDMKHLPPWLTNLALEVSIERAENLKQHEIFMDLSIVKSKQNLARPKKVKYMLQAIELAIKKNDTARITQYKKRLYKLAPRLDPQPKLKNYFKIAYDYRRVRNFKRAQYFYNKILHSKKMSELQKIEALNGLRKTQKISRDLKAHEATTLIWARKVRSYYRKAKRKKSAIKLYFKTHVDLARTLWTMGRTKKAKKVLAKLEKKLRKKHDMSMVYWLRGRILEEQKRHRSAIWWFNRALKKERPTAEMAQTILWYKAWNQRKLKKYNPAISSLIQLIAVSKNPYNTNKYNFWLAKSYRSNGQNPKAEKIFRQLIENDPIGYYGLIAHKELGESLPDYKKIRAPANSSLDLPSPALSKVFSPVLAEWLLAVGELDIMAPYLGHVSNEYQKQADQQLEDWSRIFNYYTKSGHYVHLFNQLRKISPEFRRTMLAQSPQLIFPRPFAKDVQAAVKRFGVKEELIYAIMRQESAFDPQARSPMDAFGLMQLLPMVAREVAKKSKVGLAQAHDLFLPPVNIKIGAAYLKELWAKYNQQFVLAVASYNASEEAIQGWIKTRFSGNSLEFIEDIPYNETKNYVKLVMRNYIFYLAINSGSIPFPHRTLNITGLTANANNTK